MTLIFNHDVFRGAMASFDIDVKKMPLGQLTKSQVQKGYTVLEELEDAVEGSKAKLITDLSSRFYTLIPHAFGRRVPPPINTQELVQKKYDMLNVLNDIEIALGMENKEAEATREENLQPNPADVNYRKLKADLAWVDPSTREFDVIKTYMERTAAANNKLKLIDAFRLDRKGERERFTAHDDVKERKLLWHGTNVAVVAAIVGSGLRIMPHSGGRVGRGIYLASENGKSVWYVGWSGTTGVMFLAEAALGKEHTITRDNSSLRGRRRGTTASWPAATPNRTRLTTSNGSSRGRRSSSPRASRSSSRSTAIAPSRRVNISCTRRARFACATSCAYSAEGQLGEPGASTPGFWGSASGGSRPRLAFAANNGDQRPVRQPAPRPEPT